MSGAGWTEYVTGDNFFKESLLTPVTYVTRWSSIGCQALSRTRRELFHEGDKSVDKVCGH
jgi:hypothetical protein